MYKIACTLTSLVLAYEEDVEDKEMYIYGFQIIAGKVLTYVITIFLGIIFNHFFEMITFISFVMLLRGYTGGFHLDNSLGCIISTVGISIISILIADNFKIRFAIVLIPVLLILSSICINVLSPINHPNLQLSKHEITKCNRLSKQVLVVELLCILLLLVFHVKASIIVSASLAIIFVAILMIIAKIIKQEVEYDK